MSSILIAGGAGYIGSHMAWQIFEAGHHVVILDDLSSGHQEVLPPQVPFFLGSIADHTILTKIFEQYNIDVVFHFAAFIDVGESVQNPARYYQNNVGATLNLLDSMCAHGIKKIIFSSSAAVYGEPEYTPVDIHHPTSPVNAYGRTKLMVEQILQDYDKAYNLRSISFRYFNASGADPLARTGELHRQESHLIPMVLQVASGKRSHIEIYGQDYPTPDGTCIRDFVHVFDLCRAHLFALKWLREGGTSKTYNLGSGTGFSVQKVIETSRSITQAHIPSIIRPRRPGDPAILVANSHQIKHDFGWTPHFDQLTEILRHAWTWEQQNVIAQQGKTS
jgi:UDP-glucose 4-epimerase